MNSYLLLLEAKCLQLDSNFIANNLRLKDGFETFFIIIKCFHLLLASILDAILDKSKCSMMPGWHHSEIFQGQCIHYQNQQRKKV